MISKPLLIGGVVAVGALLLFAGSSNAAQGPAILPPVPRPPDEPPILPPLVPPAAVPPEYYEIPEVTVYGDPAALAFRPETKALAVEAASRVQAGEGAACAYSPAVHAFQAAYNADPVSKHPENVLGTYDRVVYALKEDGKFGVNSATAVFYVTGLQLASKC